MPPKTQKTLQRKFDRRCGNKKAYETLALAKAAAWNFTKSREKAGNPIVTFLQAYGCQCGKFHIGSSRQINWEAVLGTK